ncbi:MAG TPA: gluconate 2-dehydrogenase subunit 3 family protein [Candidatus Acidoferrales bacterium]|jgi:gluconate 2-dehydrogenase gamma chain|nr:gluconate 2-dehydrogenase subunit 3 family protein [Candidatus Acidoferrales bacterium]
MVKHVFSRREVLRAGLAGAAATTVPAGALAASAAAPFVQIAQQTTAEVRRHFETLSATEADTLEAIVARLIPTDANGPGAAEAGAAHYIDRALGGALASSRSAYTAGLAAIEMYARATKGAPFAKLTPADRDAILAEMERNAAPGFTPNSAAFFELLRNHTIQGTFCDPYYGGNANFVGWDLLGYPGVRTVVTPEQQRMGIVPAPNHKSAYDYDMFQKASAKMIARRGGTDGV